MPFGQSFPRSFKTASVQQYGLPTMTELDKVNTALHRRQPIGFVFELCDHTMRSTCNRHGSMRRQ